MNDRGAKRIPNQSQRDWIIQPSVGDAVAYAGAIHLPWVCAEVRRWRRGNVLASRMSCATLRIFSTKGSRASFWRISGFIIHVFLNHVTDCPIRQLCWRVTLPARRAWRRRSSHVLCSGNQALKDQSLPANVHRCPGAWATRPDEFHRLILLAGIASL